MSQYFTGLDDLRAQLEANGWRIYPKHLGSDGNACNWIACMKTAEALRLPSKQLDLL